MWRPSRLKPTDGQNSAGSPFGSRVQRTLTKISGGFDEACRGEGGGGIGPQRAASVVDASTPASGPSLSGTSRPHARAAEATAPASATVRATGSERDTRQAYRRHGRWTSPRGDVMGERCERRVGTRRRGAAVDEPFALDSRDGEARAISLPSARRRRGALGLALGRDESGGSVEGRMRRRLHGSAIASQSAQAARGDGALRRVCSRRVPGPDPRGLRRGPRGLAP